METEVVKIDPIKPDAARIKEAAGVVDAGGLVAFPTETVYGIGCRAKTGSLTRLGRVKSRGSEKPYTLHISRKSEVEKYVPTVGIRVQKLIENAWPGPLTVVFELNAQDIEKQRNSLEREVFENLYKDNSIGIRCPDNAIASMLLGETHSTVVAPSANRSGQPPAVNSEQVLAQLSGQIDLLLDGGPCKFKKSSTVVKIAKGKLEILREGVYSPMEVGHMSRVSFLFVCTGNTCRSPMAEGMFRKYLAEKLGCSVDQLGKIGYKTVSAGVMNMVGGPASSEAVTACATKGTDIRAHRSRALTEQFVRECDFIFAMCRTHREHVISLGPEAGSKCMLLAEGEDIADPIGQPQHVYDHCADLIEKAVKKRIGELVI